MAQLKSTSVTGNLSITGNILASKIIKLGGTDDDILMGDGSTTSKQGLIDSLEAAMEGNSWRPVKYGTTTVSDTSTTLEFIAGSNIGLTFTNGQLTIANNYSYSLPLAANGTRGGIQIGYTASGANLPVQLSSEKAYVALTKTAVESVVTIPTVNDGTLTLKASDGATATQQTFTANDADSVTFEVKHAVPTGASATSYGPSDGGTQTAKGTLNIVVPQITTDKFGHITSVSNKTFKVTDTDTNTWQANTKDQDGYVTKGSGQANKVWKTDADGVPGWRTDSNIDTKVTQSNTTTANWRKVILSNQSDAAMGTATTAKTDVVYVTPKIEAQPSTGSLRMEGNLLLHNPSDGDSPKLVFQRGDEKGNVTDWNMYVNKGALKINSIPTSGSAAEKNIAEFAYNGGMTIYSPGDSSGVETASMTVKTSNGGQLIIGKEGPNSGTMLRFDQKSGTPRLRFRASGTDGAMVWEQPESNSGLYLDVNNVYFRNTTGIVLSHFTNAGYLYTDASGNLKSAAFPTIPTNITITDTTDATTKPIIGDITASGHTITVSRIGLSDLGLASAYKFKGSKDKYENLPTSNNVIGDVWNVTDTGMNYAWTESGWDALGWIVDTNNFVTKDGVQTISGVKTFSAQPVISTANGLKFASGNCSLRIYNTSASSTDYAAIEVRSNNTSTNRNLFIDLANNSLVVGAASGTPDTTYKVNVKDTFNATTIYENGKNIATQEWVTTQLSGGDSDGSGYIQGSGTANYIPKFTAAGAIGDSILSADNTTVTTNGNMLLKQYLKINAWTGYGTGSANFWYDGNKKTVAVENMSELRFGNDGPYATRTTDTLTENTILIGAGTSSDKYKITTSSKTITNTLGTDDTTIPTSKAVATYVTGLLEDLELGDNYQPKDTDLTAIAGLGDSATTGLLRKKAKNSWEIDTNTYLKPGSNASANYLAFFKDGDEVSGSQNTHCDGVGNIKAASYGIYTDVANNKVAKWQYNSSTDCVELMWN